MSGPVSIPSEPVDPVDFESTVLEVARRIRLAYEVQGVPATRTIEGSRLVCSEIYGYLRGRIPYPVPPDLMGVAVSAGLRISKGFAHTGTMFLQDGKYNGSADFRPWAGFMLNEKVTLGRYRQRTA